MVYLAVWIEEGWFVLQFFQHQDLLVTIEKNLRGVISIVTGDKFIESTENTTVLSIGANNLSE